MQLTWGSVNVNDSDNFSLRAGADFGQRVQEQRTILSPIGGVARQGQKRFSGPRVVKLPLRVYGTSADDLRVNLAVLAAEMSKATNTLTVQPTGASTSRTITLLDQVAYGMPPLDPKYESRKVADVDITLVAEPDVKGAEVTALNASAQTAPLLLSLGTGAVTGDFPTPLELTIAGNGADLHSVYVGVLKSGSSLALTDLQKNAPVAGAGWTGAADEDVSDAKFVGGHAIGIQTATESTAVLFDTTAIRALDAGSYVPLPRIMTNDTAKTATVRLLSRVGATDTLIESLTTALGTPEYRHCAPLAMPLTATASTAPTIGLVAGVAAADATNGDEAVLDNVTLLPASWTWAGVHAAAGADYTTVQFGYDGSVYVDNLADYSVVVAPGPLLVYPGTSKLVIVADTVAAAASAAITVTAKFKPRYAYV